MKTLPCPKLHLRAVIKIIVWFHFLRCLIMPDKEAEWYQGKCYLHIWLLLTVLVWSLWQLLFTLLAFMVICLVIISEWPPLSHRLLLFWWIECQAMGQLTGLMSVGGTVKISSNDHEVEENSIKILTGIMCQSWFLFSITQMPIC